MHRKISSACVYTIRHSRELDAVHSSGGSGELHERSPWTTGRRILESVRKNGERVPLLFAPAEADIIDGIIYWALIDEIEMGPNGTWVAFSELQPLPQKQPLHSLIRLRTGTPLSDSYIRPYVPCQTPSFIFDLAGGSPPRRVNDERVSAFPKSTPIASRKSPATTSRRRNE
jgi:hypothetical protein